MLNVAAWRRDLDKISTDVGQDDDLVSLNNIKKHLYMYMKTFLRLAMEITMFEPSLF